MICALGLATSELCRSERWKSNSSQVYAKMTGTQSGATAAHSCQGSAGSPVAMQQKPVPPALAKSHCCSKLACSFFGFSESLVMFVCNFLWQRHQLFSRIPVPCKWEPWGWWHADTSPNERQMGSPLSSWVSAHPYCPIFHSHTTSFFTAGTADQG